MSSAHSILEVLIKDMVNRMKFSKYSLEVAGNTAKGDGYLGELTFVKVTATSGNEQEKTFDLVVKTAKQDEEFRNNTPIIDAFEREIFMYTKVFPAFLEFQSERNIEKSLTNYAKCYHTCSEDKREAIILQNLKYCGYEIHDRMTPQNLEHVTLVFENYAKFHAVSLAMKRRNAAVFHNLTKNMSDIFSRFLQQAKMTEVIVRDFNKCVDLLRTNGSENLAKKYDAFDEKVWELSLVGIVDNTSQSVILHGDCWNNNMMFKYESSDKTKPNDMVFLDFQLSRVGSPIVDLSHYLYSCANKPVLDKIDFLLQKYHNKLSQSLKQLGCDSDEILTLDYLKNQWGNYGRFGLMMSSFLVKLELSESDEVVDFSECTSDGNVLQAFDKYIKNKQIYDERMLDVYTHFAEKFL